MRCIQCGSHKDKVVDSRMSKDGTTIRRRRECLDCSYRYTTYEQIERTELRVVKKDGSRETINREKLFRGLVKACEKRPVSMDRLDRAVEEILADLHKDHVSEVPSHIIGTEVMDKLHQIDPVAYVRYVSVYRQFDNVGEFISEIQSLETRGPPATTCSGDSSRNNSVMICLVGKLPVLQVGRHQVAGYGTEWIDVALHRAARSCDRADFPFIDDIRDGILHYLEHKCPWRVLPLEDLFERMKRMLRRIGCDAIANNLNPLAPPITLSIARAAREAGNGFELVFFQKLQKEIDDLHARGAEEFHFTELRESARILRGAMQWTPPL